MHTEKHFQFATLLQQHTGIVYSTISKYGHEGISHEDLFQEVALRAWQAYDRFRGDAKFSTWLAYITRNTCVDAWRRLKTTVQTVAFSNCLFEVDLADNTEEYQEPVSLPTIDSFTTIEKTTLNYILEGLSYKQISALTGEPTNRIAVRMHRIKKEFAKHL